MAYGSSPVRRTIITQLVGLTGPTGNPGSAGAVGPIGNTGLGATGNTGFSLLGITLVNNILVSQFNDTNFQSQQIRGATGNYHLNINGISLSFTQVNFLKTVTDSVLYTDALDQTYPNTDIITFRNISTTTPDSVTIETSPDGETINVKYNLVDISALQIQGGPLNSLIKNNVGNIASGYTGSTYSSSDKYTDFVMSNVYEKVKVVNANFRSSTTIQVWTIDPNKTGDFANVFYLGGQKANATESWIIIKTPENSNYSHAINIIAPAITTEEKPLRFYYTNSSLSASMEASSLSPVIWPLGDAPCFSGNYDLFNLISLGSQWYGYITSYDRVITTGSGISNPGFTYDNKIDRSTLYGCYPTSFTTRSTLIQGITFGLCCDETCGYTYTTNIACNGPFTAGLTYQAGLTLCDTLGACCLFAENKSIGCNELTYCDCATIANESNLTFKWSKFTGLKQSCLDFNCTNKLLRIGACCDGSGSCIETTDDLCSGYWQGEGVRCETSEGLNVCYYGFGACCDSGVTCENNINGEICFSEDKTYFGDGSACSLIECSRENIPCFSIIPNITLNIGDEYADGIVAGIFNPNGSLCFGSPIFGNGDKQSYSVLTNSGRISNSISYQSRYDFSGYGFTALGNICNQDGDSYIMIVSKYPITIDENGEIVSSPTKFSSNQFVWNSGGNSWGPLLRTNTLIIDDADFEDLGLFEGYIYNSGFTASQTSLGLNSFPPCEQIRVLNDQEEWINARFNTSFNGKWYRNYGLLNTARMINAEFIHYSGLTASGIDDGSFEPRIDTEFVSAARAISLFNESFPETNEMISDWFIPSHDELGFLAKHCINSTAFTNNPTFRGSDATFNLNITLLEKGYAALDGWHWSSTGSFTDGSNEYILNHPQGLTHGTSSWALYFDIDGNLNSFSVAKKNRTENYYKIRPIKMIRCDGRYYSLSNENNKYWRLNKIDERLID
jgi:hypothetical protein